jgi:hypothetical protein
MRCAVAKPTLHEKALRLFGEIKRTDKQEKARHVVAEYNALVQDQKVNLKPVLDEMDAAFSRGEVIGGATSLKSWCKMYKHEGVLTYARCRQIITGKSGHEGKVKRLDLDSLIGKTFKQDGQEYKITRLGMDFFEKGHSIHLSIEPVQPEVTAAPAPSLSPSGRNYRKERAAKKVAIQRARLKVHAVDPQNEKNTLCMKDTKKYPTAEGDAVTCGNCRSHQDAVARWEAYLQEHPAERGWGMWSDEYHWRSKDGRKMEKTKRKKEYTVWDDDGVIGVADSYEAGCALKREATLTVVMNDAPPQGTPQHVIDRVAEIKRRAALGLPQGDTCPNEEEAV